MPYLHNKIERFAVNNQLINVPNFVPTGLAPFVKLRKYQKDAIRYFITYWEDPYFSQDQKQHLLFKMATGSGKTVVMASLMLYLYTKGYRKVVFFVNQTNIVEKTKDNFISRGASKYLFNIPLEINGQQVRLEQVDNFSSSVPSGRIEIIFSTIQGMHTTLNNPKENAPSYEDILTDKILYMADEAHHLNAATTKTQKENVASWETTVQKCLQNHDALLLEFTATIDLANKSIRQKYLDKLIFDYGLRHFRNSGFTKDFHNLATTSSHPDGSDDAIWERMLIALVLSEYRRVLFTEQLIKANIKPVVLMNSSSIAESNSHYDLFFDKLPRLSSSEIRALQTGQHDIVDTAIDYFANLPGGINALEQSIRLSFNQNTVLIVNSKTNLDMAQTQKLLNTLDDKENPIRVIFTVGMLIEGWDVLSLFDIVRLYDTRQGSGVAGKVGAATIREAQLIGRGARYCPFVHNGNLNAQFVRKFDGDTGNKYRVLETFYYHCKHDSKYITELRQALRQEEIIGDPLEREYVLKGAFKQSPFYNDALVFVNKQEPVGTPQPKEIEELKGVKGEYTISTSSRKEQALIEDNPNACASDSTGYKQSVIQLKHYSFSNVPYNILSSAAASFSAFNFNAIIAKYPEITSLREFLTSSEWLGNTRVVINGIVGKQVTGVDINAACKVALARIAEVLQSTTQLYRGSKEFYEVKLCDVLKDKKVYYDKEVADGVGESYNEVSNYKLTNDDWYVFEDNFGTSLEKAFLDDFRTYWAPLLDDKGVEYYLIRNERVPDLAIYSFDDGKRFEPDFLLLIKKLATTQPKAYQSFIEPKGAHLIANEQWKEDFLLNIEPQHQVVISNKRKYTNPPYDEKDYMLIGLPFYSSDSAQKEQFKQKMINLITKS